MLNPYDLTVPGLGIINSDPAGDVAPVKLNAANTYLGVYTLDTFEATDKLTFTAGARYNLARIALYDLYSTQLNGSSSYAHLNPVVGATYKITPEVAAYASYSESNRAPTPLELGCADPNRPCLIDNFLVADPPLQQVVAHSIETGLRGNFRPAAYLPPEAGAVIPGRVDWSAGVYRTTSFNDILSVPSEIAGQGYFKNAGTTQRQGLETQIRYTDEKLSAYVNYALTDATFRSMIELGSPFNPWVVAFNTLGVPASSILVMPGSHLTSVPKHRLKGGFDYALTKEWKIGMDVVYSAGNWVRGDEINAFGTLPSYATVNLRSSYQLTKNFQIYGLIDNIGGVRARSFATFFDTPGHSLPQLRRSAPGLHLGADRLLRRREDDVLKGIEAEVGSGRGATRLSFAAGGEVLLLDRDDRSRLDLEILDHAGASAPETDGGVVGSGRQIPDRQSLVVIDRAVRVALDQVRPEILRAGRGEAQGGHGLARQIPESNGLFGRNGDARGKQQGQSAGERPHARLLDSDLQDSLSGSNAKARARLSSSALSPRACRRCRHPPA